MAAESVAATKRRTWPRTVRLAVTLASRAQVRWRHGCQPRPLRPAVTPVAPQCASAEDAARECPASRGPCGPRSHQYGCIRLDHRRSGGTAANVDHHNGTIAHVPEPQRRAVRSVVSPVWTTGAHADHAQNRRPARPGVAGLLRMWRGHRRDGGSTVSPGPSAQPAVVSVRPTIGLAESRAIQTACMAWRRRGLPGPRKEP